MHPTDYPLFCNTISHSVEFLGMTWRQSFCRHSLSNLSVDDVSRLPTTLPSNTNNQPFSWRSIQNDLENPPNVGASGGSFPTLNISKCFSNNIQSPREKGVVDVDFDDKSREETLGFTAADWQILVGQGFKPWSEVEDWQEMYNFLEEYHTNNETWVPTGYYWSCDSIFLVVR